MLSILFLYKRPILVTGDFNFHVDNCCDKPAISYVDTCSTFGLMQHVQEPANRSSHTLDLVFTTDVIVAALEVCPLTASDYYFASFQTLGAILPSYMATRH